MPYYREGPPAYISRSIVSPDRYYGIQSEVSRSEQLRIRSRPAIAGRSLSAVIIVDLSYNGQPAGSLSLTVVEAAPAIFLVVANQDGTINSQTIRRHATPLLPCTRPDSGMTNGQNISGQPATAPYALPLLPVTLTVAGIPAESYSRGAHRGWWESCKSMHGPRAALSAPGLSACSLPWEPRFRLS